MKIHELRIGNIVKYYGGEIMEVSGMDRDKEDYVGWFIRTKDGSCSMGDDENEIVQPVPITDDLLLRLGFERDVDHCLVFNVGEYGFHFTRKLDSIILVDDEDRDLPELYVNHIRSIHQLQNLVWVVTGTELQLTPLPADKTTEI